MGAPPAGTSYFQAELEAWRTLLSHALGWLIVALYVASTVVLTAYALWYIASLAGYLSRGSEDAFLPGGPRTPAAPRGPRDLERGVGGWGWPRVAVVYPVYNDYEVLASLEKALDLDYPDYIVIVVDDSSDRALSLEISKYSLRSPHRLIHVRRWERRGLKAGALNEAALLASHYGAKYMLILDADFEPPRPLLKTLVAAAERHQADVVQGHQRHYKGSHTWFGSVYRAGMAGATIFMAGRASLGMFPIFTGSVGLLRVDRVLETGFKEGSLSEDLRWTIDLVSKQGSPRIVVLPRAYADGSVPKSLRAYVRQQLRWSSGTLMEFAETWRDVLLNPRLPPSMKAGYLLQGLFYTQGLWIYVNMLAPLLGSLVGVALGTLWSLGLYVWMLGIEALILAGAMGEGYSWGDAARITLMLLPHIYVTGLIHLAGTLETMLGRRGGWVVTPKKGVFEHLYRDEE